MLQVAPPQSFPVAPRTGGYKLACDLYLPESYTQVARELGEGTFGKVYLTAHTAYPKAVKRGKHCEDGIPYDIAREFVAHRMLGQHHAIALMTDHYLLSGAVVYEPMAMSVRTLVERHGEIELQSALIITAQVCDALSHCVVHGILHRDVSCKNVLVDPESWRAVLTDFGICHFVAGTYSASTVSMGTFCFWAPEVLRDECHSYTSDVWSAAVLHLYMRLGHLPFMSQKQDTEDQLRIIKEGLDPYSGCLSAQDRAIALMGLEFDPQKRSMADGIAACARFMLADGVSSAFPWTVPTRASPPTTLYFGWRDELNSRMRQIVIEWILEVGQHQELCIATMLQAAHTLDRFVARHMVGKRFLQCVAACCLVVCSKLIDCGMTINDAMYLCADAYTIDEFSYFEALVLEDARLDPIPGYITELCDHHKLACTFIPFAFGHNSAFDQTDLDAIINDSATLRKKADQ